MKKIIESVVDAADLRVVHLGVDSIVLRFKDGGSVTIVVEPNTLTLRMVEE